jgi:hypothetical protein
MWWRRRRRGIWRRRRRSIWPKGEIVVVVVVFGRCSWVKCRGKVPFIEEAIISPLRICIITPIVFHRRSNKVGTHQTPVDIFPGKTPWTCPPRTTMLLCCSRAI